MKSKPSHLSRSTGLDRSSKILISVPPPPKKALFSTQIRVKEYFISKFLESYLCLLCFLNSHSVLKPYLQSVWQYPTYSTLTKANNLCFAESSEYFIRPSMFVTASSIWFPLYSFLLLLPSRSPFCLLNAAAFLGPDLFYSQTTCSN